MDSSVERITPGALLARQYRIDRLIGSGGFAKVYRAVQTDLDRTVAVKILHPRATGSDASPSTKAIERFEREAKLISRLRDPNTVTLYDYGELQDGRLYMVMEHVDGKTLTDLVNDEGELAPERITHILKQVLASLREAHALEIIHRDIKPGNVMVYDRIGERDSVKVLDFGVAKSVALEQRGNADLTIEGAVIGTPKYMSPEQLQGRPLTPASDLFSVGVLAYLMYAGGVPYNSNTPGVILDRMRAFANDLGDVDEAPEPLRSTIGKLMAPDIEHRFQSAEAAIEALEESTSSSETIKPVHHQSADRSATFPMGFDPEGGMESTELTGVDSSSSFGELEPASPDTGTIASSAVDSSPSEPGPSSSGPSESPSEKTPMRAARKDVTTATQVSDETGVGDGRRSAQVGLIVLGAVAVVGVLGAGIWLAADDGAPASDRGEGERASPSVEVPEPEEPGLAEAVDDAREILATSIIGATRAAEAANRAPEDDSETESAESTDESSGSPAPPSSDTPDRRPESSSESPARSGADETSSTASREHETKDSTEDSASSGVQAFDEVGESDGEESGSTTEEDESSNDFEVKAWE